MIACPNCRTKLSVLAVRAHFSCPKCHEQLRSNIVWFVGGIVLVVSLVGPFLVTSLCERGYDDIACWIPVEIVFTGAVSCLAYWSNLLRIRKDPQVQSNH